jgi:hypothetical protein
VDEILTPIVLSMHPEYGAGSPIWGSQGMVELESLELSDELKSALFDWNRAYQRNSWFDWENASTYISVGDNWTLVGVRIFEEIKAALWPKYSLVQGFG